MSRFTAVAAALALVLSGIVIGAMGTYLVVARPGRIAGMHPPGPPAGPPMSPQGPGGPPRVGGQPGPPMVPFTREMEDRLQLSDDQWRQLQEILKQGRVDSESIRRDLRPRLEAQLDATRAKIAALLTPGQRKEFETLVREDRRRADRFFLEGPPPPPPGPPPGGPPGR